MALVFLLVVLSVAAAGAGGSPPAAMSGTPPPRCAPDCLADGAPGGPPDLLGWTALAQTDALGDIHGLLAACGRCDQAEFGMFGEGPGWRWPRQQPYLRSLIFDPGL
jgi:hypothetical protein